VASWSVGGAPKVSTIAEPDYEGEMNERPAEQGAGPFCRSASSAMFEYGFPPLRIVNSEVG
jgi:hypothetical protein